MPTAIPTTVQGGIQHVSVPEESTQIVAVNLPVAGLTLDTCTCTVIDMDDPGACAIEPFLAMDALPWLVTDQPPPFLAFPLAPPATTLRWGPPNFYERRRAIFCWTGTDAGGAPVSGIVELAIDVWAVAGYPTPVACPDPPPAVPILGRADAVRLADKYGRAAVYRIPQLG